MMTSLEARVGPVRFTQPGGRAQAFPRLTAAFALFGAAGVGMPEPGQHGDGDPVERAARRVDVGLLRARLPGEGHATGGTRLTARERVVATALLGLLLVVGVAPGRLLGPADAFLSVIPPAVAAGVEVLRP